MFSSVKKKCKKAIGKLTTTKVNNNYNKNNNDGGDKANYLELILWIMYL